MSADDGTIGVTRDGPLLLMQVRRAAKMNGFTPTMFRELGEAMSLLEADPELRVGVLYPEGPHFSAGLDLPKFSGMMQRGEPMVPDGLVDPFDLREPRRDKPLVMAVRGVTFTLGVELAMAADVVVAGADSRFNQIEVKRGVMAYGGATLRMVERAGWGNAMRWLLTGDEFGADEALRMNLVSQIAPPDEVVGIAVDIARRIAAAAPQAVMATRRNARLAQERGREAAIAEFGAITLALAQTEDAVEGVAAFRERREPRFTGR